MEILVFIWSEFFFPYLPFLVSIFNSVKFMLPIVLIALLVQCLFPAVVRRPKFYSYEMAVDLIYMVQTGIIYLTVLGGMVYVARSWMVDNLYMPFAFLSSAPFYFQVFLSVLVVDFVVYWRHRIEHEIAILWPIHSVHHSSQQIDIFTTTRLHILEVMAGGVLSGWANAFLGLDPSAAALGFSIYLYYNYFIHCNIRIKFGGIFKYLFVSPFMHRWHHAIEKEAINCNYGVVFAWNDWLFKSAYLPEHEPSAYGFWQPEGEHLNESYIHHQVYPFQVWLVRIAKLIFRNSPKKQI